MAVKFTDDQQRVIDTRNKNILVSAAAGSGKTAVLVERIIQRITDQEHPIDIDKLLVVTFTNAAAVGMKERISNAIQARLALEPENVHLQRQAVLVHQAQITTIHSFCLYLIKNHFEAIGLEPDFSVADEAAVKLLAAEVKADVLEEAFQEGTEAFLYMVEFVCHNGKESALEDYIDQLYARAMSMPFPKTWLLERKKDYAFTDLEEFTQTHSGKYLLLHIQGLLRSYAEAYRALYKVAVEPDGPYMYADVLEKELAFLEKVISKQSLEEIGLLLPNMEFARLPAKKDSTVHPDKKEWVKDKRSSYKKALQELSSQFFGKSPQSISVENEACRKATEAFIDITITFMERLAIEKRKRGIIDFHDMEHMALQILLQETEHGYEATETARSYQSFFEEVMVDEYQDSNMVQEYLVNAVSGEQIGKHNRFMVGDVKQSIYKFRLARPELFMEKYHLYAENQNDNNVTGAKNTDDTKIRIDLKQNFRSRQEVLSAVNSVFERVMLPELGGIAYDESAALYPGASFPESPNMTAELIIATEDKPDCYDAKQWEAYCITKRIKELVRYGRILDETGTGFRPVTYGDIVLLLRSPSGFEEAYKQVFEQQGIPLYMTSGSGYFDTVDVQNLIKLLQAIENPRLDIPMFGVCTSVFGNMSENQLSEVKIYYKKLIQEGKVGAKKSEQCFYDMLCHYQDDFPDSETGRAIGRLQQSLKKYRRQMEYLTVAELLYEILRDFQYREYISVLPDGDKRLANVSLLLERAANFGSGGYQGVFAFTNYMNQLYKQSIDYGEAGLVESADVVRVMSIHKSKGLEFPITIVGGMGQSYQMRDKQQMILIDNDMGLGMDYINIKERSKNKTLRKNVIALKMEQEILAEEQRILYVAMTRAKEKLIMVGYKAKFDQNSEDRSWSGSSEKQTCMLSEVLEARNYLDLCLLARKEDSPILLKTMTLEDYVENEVCEITTREERKEALSERLAEDASCEAYDVRFHYEYPHSNLKDLYSKTSVSELKKAAIREENEAVFEAFEKQNEAEIVPYIPAFMKETTEPKGAELGTIYHKVMELWEFSKDLSVYHSGEKGRTAIKEAIAEMVSAGKLSERHAESINKYKMQHFLQSDIAQRIREADLQHKLQKEQSFFLGVPANMVNAEFPAEELMLVQGIIDVYFEEDDGLVLVDYKTDFIKTGQELVDRYKVQMMYYKKALEQALGKKVKEIILYSFSLEEEVKV